MNRVVVLAVSAPLLLIGAAYPKFAEAGPGVSDPPDYVAEGPVHYRPCRPGPGDDHCIQLYERGVRAHYARWLRDRRGGERPTQVAMGGPDEPVMHPRHRHHEAATRCDDEDEADEARGM